MLHVEISMNTPRGVMILREERRGRANPERSARSELAKLAGYDLREASEFPDNREQSGISCAVRK
jgi:hypothetical protein